MPEEHSQAIELDYAVDYTTYLLQDEDTPSNTLSEEQVVPKLRGHELIDGFIRQSESAEPPLCEEEEEEGR